MEGIAKHIQIIKAGIPETVTLIAVSKYFPADSIRKAYACGQRDFAESRVQELKAKEAELRTECPEIRWHFIGHLQTNKVHDLMKLPVALIQSVDSLRLMDELEKECTKSSQEIDILLEVHVAQEESKTGFKPEEVEEILSTTSRNYPHLRIRGVMGMASHTEDETEVRRCFREIAELGHKGEAQQGQECMIISMGMSEDYPIAIEEGATMIRIGSAIFEEN